MYWRRSSSATFEEFGNSCLLGLSVPLHGEEMWSIVALMPLHWERLGRGLLIIIIMRNTHHFNSGTFREIHYHHDMGISASYGIDLAICR